MSSDARIIIWTARIFTFLLLIFLFTRGSEMKECELIAKQQLEIENLKKLIEMKNGALQEIHMSCICIGGPLNDNVKGYTKVQMGDFWRINNAAECALGDVCEACEQAIEEGN